MTKQFKQDLLKEYLIGGIKLIEVRKILKITQWECDRIVTDMFNNRNHNDDNNFIYDKRIAEVTKQRTERFTPQQIATQLF